VGVLVHDDWHTGNKHENSWDRYAVIILLVQDHKGFFLCWLAIFPLMFGNEDLERRLLLPLENSTASMFKFQRFLFSSVTTVMPQFP
jgi:hypothetical protein